MIIRKCKQSCEDCNKDIGCFDLIYFDKFKEWDYYSGFAYDSITDNEITKAMKFIGNADIEKEWQDDLALESNKSINYSIKHAVRVAALVNEISKGNGVDPVVLDTFSAYKYRSPSGVVDGNHRIRALQFLKYSCFPASCSGHVFEINKFRRRYHRHWLTSV